LLRILAAKPIGKPGSEAKEQLFLRQIGMVDDVDGKVEIIDPDIDIVTEDVRIGSLMLKEQVGPDRPLGIGQGNVRQYTQRIAQCRVSMDDYTRLPRDAPG